MTTTTKTLLSTDDPLIDMVFITTCTGMSDKWFFKQISEGRFPKPIKLGRSSRWRKSELEAWMRERVVDSRGEES
ncbi:AlpA family phage regulatory protein [Salmonella enterica subsp. enterica serovar Newport]|nr:AlpA family phage regulatory protein [Salmonella enterica]EII7450278.1 AlpA family phage regulatory protein [Salmonella enterica subsp. enterica serovar Newport]